MILYRMSLVDSPLYMPLIDIPNAINLIRVMINYFLFAKFEQNIRKYFLFSDEL